MILLDLVMPRTNGWTVLRHLHSRPRLRNIPVLLLTAVYPEPGILPPRESYHSLFQKPFNFDELLAVASQLAGRRDD